MKLNKSIFSGIALMSLIVVFSNFIAPDAHALSFGEAVAYIKTPSSASKGKVITSELTKKVAKKVANNTIDSLKKTIETKVFKTPLAKKLPFFKTVSSIVNLGDALTSSTPLQSLVEAGLDLAVAAVSDVVGTLGVACGPVAVICTAALSTVTQVALDALLGDALLSIVGVGAGAVVVENIIEGDGSTSPTVPANIPTSTTPDGVGVGVEDQTDSTTGIPYTLGTCDDSIIYSDSGNVALPQVDVITLPAQAGTLVFDYEAYYIPDRFVVQYGSNIVIDTKYVGSTSYTVSEVNAVLASVGFILTTQSGIIPPGDGSQSFGKTTTTADTAIVRVFAPLDGTAWDVKLTFTCPSTGSSSVQYVPVSSACEIAIFEDSDTVQLVKDGESYSTRSFSQYQDVESCVAGAANQSATDACYESYIPELVPYLKSCAAP